MFAPSLVRWTSVREVAKPSAPGVERLADERGHRVELVVGRRLRVVGAAVAHDVGAQRGVGDVRADVDACAACALERVEVLGERLPVPREALGQRGAGDVLDAFEQADQPVVAVGARPGANPTPQLPIAIVVTPWSDDGATIGSQVTWPSKWVWMSTKPGVTSRPSASISRVPVLVDVAHRGDESIR